MGRRHVRDAVVAHAVGLAGCNADDPLSSVLLAGAATCRGPGGVFASTDQGGTWTDAFVGHANPPLTQAIGDAVPHEVMVIFYRDVSLARQQEIKPFATRIEKPCIALESAAVSGASTTRCTWLPCTENSTRESSSGSVRQGTPTAPIQEPSRGSRARSLRPPRRRVAYLRGSAWRASHTWRSSPG